MRAAHLRPRPLCGLWLAASLLSACAEAPPAPPTAPEPFPAFELHDVVGPKIQALEETLAAETTPLPEAPADLDEQVEGLVLFLTSARGSMVDAAFDDAKRLGGLAVAPLYALYLDTARLPDERRSALRLLGELRTPSAIQILAEIAGKDPEPAMRSLAAWKLGTAGDDSIVPALLRALKYEKEAEVVPWLARSLAVHGNYAGGEALRVLANWQGAGGEAWVHLMQITADAAFGDTPADADALLTAWETGDPEGRLQLTRSHSNGWRLALWRWVEVFEEFQLRGVDDGRYILSQMGPDAAAELIEALHDENRYVRTHVAQALGRMGPRGRGAAVTLAAGLGDSFLAPYAAEALGAVSALPRVSELEIATRTPLAPLALDARTVLEDCTRVGRDPGLRLAGVRALGTLGDPAAAERLELLARESDFPELQQAATESLAYIGQGQRVAPRLIAYARRQDLDPGTSLRALRFWLGEADRAGEPWATDAVAAWDALAPSPYAAPTAAEDQDRRAARLALLEAALATGEPVPTESD